MASVKVKFAEENKKVIDWLYDMICMTLIEGDKDIIKDSPHIYTAGLAQALEYCILGKI